MRKLTVIMLALLMVLSSATMAMAAPFDLIKADGSETHSFIDFIDSPSIFDEVANNMTEYLIEDSNGQLFRVSEVQDSLDAGAETLADAVVDLTPVEINEELTVESVSAINDVEVEFGTPVEELELPETVEVTLSNEETDVANVEWNTENYDPELAGEQEIEGTLVVPEGKEWTIPEELLAVTVKVIVGEDERVEVKEAKAVNATTVEVTFAEDVELTEEDLADKVITLIEGETELTAKYIEASLSEGTARFLLVDSKKLEDAKTYTLSADWAKFAEDTFVAKVVAPYINEVIVTTESIPAAAKNKVYFVAKNQYGEDIKLDSTNTAKIKATATLNGVPMMSTEVTYTAGNEYATIVPAVAEGNKIVLTFTNEIATKDVKVGEANFTVVKGAEVVPTTIGNLEAVIKDAESNPAKEILPGYSVKLTVVVKDQFGNPITDGAKNKVRWVVEAGKDLITDDSGNAIAEVLDAVDFTFKAKNAGDVQISAYLLNGQKVTYTAKLGAAKLEELNYAKVGDTVTTITDATEYFNNDTLLVRIVEPNAGATLTPDMIKFEVKTNTKDTTTDDVTVTAALRGDVDENCPDGKEKEIVIVVKSTKAGKYTITPYVGESLEKAVAKGTAFDITTTIDETIKSIDPITFEATELKLNKDIKKDIVFRNKHGEVVVFNDDVVKPTIAPTQTEGSEKLTATVTKDAETNKNVLTLNATAAGQYAVTVVKDAGFINIPLTFTAPKLTSIVVGGNVTGVVAGDHVDKAVYSEIKFLDQDNIGMNVNAGALAVTVTKPDGNALENATDLITLGKAYTVNEKTGVVTFETAESTDAVVAYKVLPAGSLTQGTYTVKIADKATGKIASEFTVKVGAERAVKTIELVPETIKLAVDGTATLNIVTKDQYGDFIAVGTDKLTVTSANEAAITVDSVTEVEDDDSNVIGYKVTVTAAGKGSSEVTVTSTEVPTATAKVTFTVDAAGNLVDTVAINTKGIKDLYSTETAAKNVQLSAAAKDAEGNTIPGTELIWSVKEIKNAKGEVVATGVTVDATGKVTADQNFVGSATIEVMAVKAGGATTTDTITLNFDNAPSAAVMSTLMLIDADEEEVTKLEISEATTVTLVAKDQYGNDFTFSADTVQILVGDKTIVTATETKGAITITPVVDAEGTTTVIINYNGKTFTISVTVVPPEA